MNRAAADFAAGFEDGFVNVMAPHALASKSRQQCGVNIHNTVFVFGWNHPQAKPASLDNQVDTCFVERFFDLAAELIGIRIVFRTNDHRLETDLT